MSGWEPPLRRSSFQRRSSGSGGRRYAARCRSAIPANVPATVESSGFRSLLRSPFSAVRASGRGESTGVFGPGGSCRTPMVCIVGRIRHGLFFGGRLGGHVAPGRPLCRSTPNAPPALESHAQRITALLLADERLGPVPSPANQGHDFQRIDVDTLELIAPAPSAWSTSACRRWTGSACAPCSRSWASGHRYLPLPSTRPSRAWPGSERAARRGPGVRIPGWRGGSSAWPASPRVAASMRTTLRRRGASEPPHGQRHFARYRIRYEAVT